MKHTIVRSAGFVLLISLMMITSYASAQRREGRAGIRKHQRGEVLVTLPREHSRIALRGKEYYFANGIYYQVGPGGYVAIPAPIGARIKVLPGVYSTVTVRTVPLFLSYNTYYQYNPAAKEYEVVNPDSVNAAPAAQIFDEMKLVDGRTLFGTFMGGTKSLVQFDTSGVIQEYPIEQIILITFAPPAKK
ncbi:MAG: DUF6515 family protein [Bacteroidota bacterium]